MGEQAAAERDTDDEHDVDREVSRVAR